jgi:small subunit ribosomal protein S20
MANTVSAKKSARQNEKCRQRNLARRTAIKTSIKKFMTALETPNSSVHLLGLLRDVEAKLARAKGKGIVHANTAARKLSRLAKKATLAQQRQSQAASEKSA